MLQTPPAGMQQTSPGMHTPPGMHQGPAMQQQTGMMHSQMHMDSMPIGLQDSNNLNPLVLECITTDWEIHQLTDPN